MLASRRVYQETVVTTTHKTSTRPVQRTIQYENSPMTSPGGYSDTSSRKDPAERNQVVMDTLDALVTDIYKTTDLLRRSMSREQINYEETDDETFFVPKRAQPRQCELPKPQTPKPVVFEESFTKTTTKEAECMPADFFKRLERTPSPSPFKGFPERTPPPSGVAGGVKVLPEKEEMFKPKHVPLYHAAMPEPEEEEMFKPKHVPNYHAALPEEEEEMFKPKHVPNYHAALPEPAEEIPVVEEPIEDQMLRDFGIDIQKHKTPERTMKKKPTTPNWAPAAQATNDLLNRAISEPPQEGEKICAYCNEHIKGPCLTALAQNAEHPQKFHPPHFMCNYCLKPLNLKGIYKEYERKPYCHDCFYRLYGGLKMPDTGGRFDYVPVHNMEGKLD